VSEDDTRINFPATCPECGRQREMEFKPAYIRECLDTGTPITMWMKCHDKTWTASAAEVQQLRALLEQWETDGGKAI
jgi:hypothetical protein